MQAEGCGLYLGVDGGGTGCRAAVADGLGRIIGQAEGGPANVNSDPERAFANIAEAVGRAMEAAGVARVAQAGLGLAGANAANVHDRLAAIMPAGRVRVETDALTATMGALGGRDGVVAAIGTGSVFGRLVGDRFRQIGGRGLVLGDEGSGAWMGRAALSDALRAEDGHAELTPYLAGLLARHGGGAGVIGFAQTARPADFAALMPEMIAAASGPEPDPAAQSVLSRAKAEIREAIAILRGADDLPVVFLGGLGPYFRAALAAEFPVADAVGNSLDGALRLARQA
ncbi:MAG: BadF/BadG/BcrA/BcrD ATPase family protein [Paracoccus sp. (in: a-proteobacteria)]|nr:BadF/BadG/BcrA/BcrD ATPase family protein [Paracoccus sp. (in: a-proteobacteria)]